MKTVNIKDLNRIKMSVNPPKCVVESDYCVIHNGMVKQYVGIGWIEVAPATPKDYETIPQIVE